MSLERVLYSESVSGLVLVKVSLSQAKEPELIGMLERMSLERVLYSDSVSGLVLVEVSLFQAKELELVGMLERMSLERCCTRSRCRGWCW